MVKWWWKDWIKCEKKTYDNNHQKKMPKCVSPPLSCGEKNEKKNFLRPNYCLSVCCCQWDLDIYKKNKFQIKKKKNWENWNFKTKKKNFYQQNQTGHTDSSVSSAVLIHVCVIKKNMMMMMMMNKSEKQKSIININW